MHLEHYLFTISSFECSLIGKLHTPASLHHNQVTAFTWFQHYLSLSLSVNLASSSFHIHARSTSTLPWTCCRPCLLLTLPGDFPVKVSAYCFWLLWLLFWLSALGSFWLPVAACWTISLKDGCVIYSSNLLCEFLCCVYYTYLPYVGRLSCLLWKKTYPTGLFLPLLCLLLV